MARRQTVVREERFTLLLTVAERGALDRRAAQAGVDRSTYVRLVLFGFPLDKSLDRSESSEKGR